MGAIRFLLAIAVVVAHLNVFVFPEIPNQPLLLCGVSGTYAVMLFFVVSGFLMSFVLDEKYPPDRAGTLAFYRARFLRIYPLWWAMVVIIVYAVERRWLSHPAADLISTITLIGPELRTAFADYPLQHSTFPGPLGIGWSLAVEVLFYICAPFLLRANKVCAVLLVLLGAARYCVYLWHPYGGQWVRFNYEFFPTLLPFFLAGHFARLIWQRLPFPYWIGLFTFAASLVEMYRSYGGAFDNLSFYMGVGMFALSMPPIFAMTKNSRLMKRLGDLTYPLYLTHLAIITVAADVPLKHSTLGQKFHGWAAALPLPPLGQFAVASVLFLPFAIGAAVIVHYFIERPARTCTEWMLGAVRFRRLQPSLQPSWGPRASTSPARSRSPSG